MTNKSQKYIDLGYIDVDDDVFFEYNYEAANCFGNNYLGTIQSGGGNVRHKYDDNISIGFPKFFQNESWENSQMLNYKKITEKCLDKSKIKDILEGIENGPKQRIIFGAFYDKMLNDKKCVYKFLGLYEFVDLDEETGSFEWKRKKTRVETYPAKIDV